MGSNPKKIGIIPLIERGSRHRLRLRLLGDFMNVQLCQDFIENLNNAVICLHSELMIELAYDRAANLFGLDQAKLVRRSINSVMNGA